jgi:hypothetical protein
MMPLEIQIKSLLFSFIFGVFFAVMYNLNKRYIYGRERYYKIITTFLFIINLGFFYYLVLLKINFGIIHPYFLIMIYVGFVIANKKIKSMDKDKE